MHIPSERVYREMRSEDASLWIVPADGGDEMALLIKAPTTALKALIAGCSLQLLLGKQEGHLCTGVRILDVSDAPLLVAGVQREMEERQALSRLIQERKTPVFLFNEMDVCVAWTNFEISAMDALRIAQFYPNIEKLYIGPWTAECSCALDDFCEVADLTQSRSLDFILEKIIVIQAILEPWRSIQNSFIGTRESHTISIDNRDEGEMHERTVWAALESVFPQSLFKSPQVKSGEQKREMTDILAFYEYGCFLFETKDLLMLNAGYERNQEKRTVRLQRHVSKAIKQLKGAHKAIVNEEDVFDSANNKLHIVRDQPAHCIVLVTELMPWGEWGEIERQLMDEMITLRIFFHVIDLRELIILLKGSAGDAYRFDYNLIQRCKLFVEKGTIHIRSKIIV